jgi:Papain family cysteine protease
LTTGDVYRYFANAGGLATEQSYPFQPEKGYQCIWNYTMDGIQLVGPYGYSRVTPNDEEQLKRALRMKGPITVMF